MSDYRDPKVTDNGTASTSGGAGKWIGWIVGAIVLLLLLAWLLGLFADDEVVETVPAETDAVVTQDTEVLETDGAEVEEVEVEVEEVETDVELTEPITEDPATEEELEAVTEDAAQETEEAVEDAAQATEDAVEDAGAAVEDAAEDAAAEVEEETEEPAAEVEPTTGNGRPRPGGGTLPGRSGKGRTHQSVRPFSMPAPRARDAPAPRERAP